MQICFYIINIAYDEKYFKIWKQFSFYFIVLQYIDTYADI